MRKNRHLYRSFAALLIIVAACDGPDGLGTRTSNLEGSASTDPTQPPPDAYTGTGSGSGSATDPGSGSGSDGSGSGSDSDTPPPEPPDDTQDLCYQLEHGTLTPDQMTREDLDECRGTSPVPPSCSFTPYFEFDAGQMGCHVTDSTYGDLGNHDGDCPTNIYDQQELCDFAIAQRQPALPTIDPVPWNSPQDPFVAAPPAPTDKDEFTNPQPGYAVRNVVVIGSSMLATHNQDNNGKQCDLGNKARPETTVDSRGLPGSDFTKSPAWSSRVPWVKAFAGARTGHKSDHVRNAGMNTPDACKKPWGRNVSPMNAGVAWLANKSNKLMITDGGLINDQESTTGSWSDTLEGIVTCQAMQRAVNSINVLLAGESRALNPNPFGWVRMNGRWVKRVSPVMRVRRSVPQGNWAGALDLPANVAKPKCEYFLQARGQGVLPIRTINALQRVQKEIPPLIRLWRNGPNGSPVPGNLTAIKNAYVGVSKQIWVQYPYMDQAKVTVKGSDLSLFFQPGGAPAKLIQAWGQNVAISINAIDPGLWNRIKQVTDDLNELMYNSIGCNAVAAFAKGHKAMICAKDVNQNPTVVITQDNYPNWGPADHQETIIGGMPHESPAGANKMGAAIVAADAL